MAADSFLPLALPVFFPFFWAIYMIFRPPAGFVSVAAPLGLQCGALVFLGLAVFREKTIHLDAPGGWPAGGMGLLADGLSVVLSAVTLLVFAACVFYSIGYFQLHRLWKTKTLTRERFFWPFLAVLWGALQLLWTAGDLVTTYIALEMMGISAAAMMVLPEKAEAVSAGLRYLFFMLSGSLAYLLGMGICYGT